MDIDQQFVDYDFSKDPRFVFGYKGIGDTGKFASYEDSQVIHPRDQWEAIAEKIQAEKAGTEWLVTRIYDQKNEGSCVANACSQANEIVQAKQFGKDRVVHLSAMSLYQRIGSGPNSGAMVSDGMEEMQSRGVLPLDNPENRAAYGDQVMPNTGWRTSKPSGWEATAKKFKAVECLVVRSTEGLASALLNGHPVVVGRQGHSICYCGVVFKNGRLNIAYANSWGGGSSGWGSPLGEHQSGFGFDSESQFRQSAGWAFAVRSVIAR